MRLDPLRMAIAALAFRPDIALGIDGNPFGRDRFWMAKVVKDVGKFGVFRYPACVDECPEMPRLSGEGP
jgi:hypothetical protein